MRGVPRWLHVPLVVSSYLAAGSAAVPNASTCLPNAVLPDLRKDLTDGSQESYPVGVLVGAWSSAELLSAVFEILIEEVLGYNVRVEPQQPLSSVDGFYALLGCANWTNLHDRGCSQRRALNHLFTESWYRTYLHIYDELKGIYKAEMAIDGGDMGFRGDSGQFVQKAVADTAHSTEGLTLEYYRSYNASWHNASRYFDSLDDINTSRLMDCSESLLSDHATAAGYLQWTGDVDGVVADGSQYKAACPDGKMWRSPSCRTSPSECILFVTSGDGYGVAEMMQRSATFALPLAIAVAKSAEWKAISKSHKTMFYWWTPDDGLLDVSPAKILFPAYDAFAWSEGDFLTAAAAVQLSKMIRPDLPYLAPDIGHLLAESRFDLPIVNKLMREYLATGYQSRKDVACRWLLQNEQRWRTWIPDQTTCQRGFGLYDELASGFVTNRSMASTCRACPSGTFSKPLTGDDFPTTHVCQACPAGQQQPSAGSIACEACPAGTAKSDESLEDCSPCLQGEYQDELGAVACKACPEGTTTLLLGVKEGASCGCKADTIDVSNGSTTADCAPCSEGLGCPVLSSLRSLNSGSSSLGSELVPKVLPGYFSSEEDPLVVYKCLSQLECPGGRPGTCANDLQGQPCGDCPQGTFMTGNQCLTCGAGAVIAWCFAVVVILVGLVAAYYLLNGPVTAKASTLFTTTCAMGMMISMLQSLGILGTMTVEWPISLGNVFDFLQIFTFDIDGLGFACLAGSSPVIRYVSTVIFFPVALAWLLSCGGILRWDPIKLRSTMGQFMQVGFSTMGSTALVPMICYTHPNLKQSILKHPGIFCGSEPHTVMLVAGSLLLSLGVCGFFSLCCWLAYMAPKFSNSGRNDRIQSSRFLLARFRLDVWWYGVPLLLRGPLLALTVVVAPDAPAVQVLGCQIILISFISLQLYSWPWKAPILNLLDFLISFLLTVLVSVTGFYVPAVTGDLLAGFQIFGAAVVVILFGSVGLMLLLAGSALVFRTGLGSQKELKIMTAGGMPSAQTVSSHLQAVVETLSEWPAQDLKTSLEQLSVYDLNNLILGLSVLDREVVMSHSNLVSRVASSSFTSSFTKPPKAPAKAVEADSRNSDNEKDDVDVEDNRRNADNEKDIVDVEDNRREDPVPSSWREDRLSAYL